MFHFVKDISFQIKIPSNLTMICTLAKCMLIPLFLKHKILETSNPDCLSTILSNLFWEIAIVRARIADCCKSRIFLIGSVDRMLRCGSLKTLLHNMRKQGTKLSSLYWRKISFIIHSTAWKKVRSFLPYRVNISPTAYYNHQNGVRF